MSSIMKLLRRIGGAKATPTSGDEGQLAVWKAGKAATDATSVYFHDGVQWGEILDTAGQWTNVGNVFGATVPSINRTVGNVGIGVPLPVDRLHVAGNIRSEGHLSVSSTHGINLFGDTANDFIAYNYSTNRTKMAGHRFYNGMTVEYLRIDENSNVHVVGLGTLGYGTGSGSTVTQSGSKGVDVALNRANGTIFTAASSLAAGASAIFNVTSNKMTATSVVILTVGHYNYEAHASRAGAGSFTISLKNISAAPLAELVKINFAIINGSNS